MNDEEFENELKKQKWRFAKSYAKTAPHEYFLKHENPKLFQEILNRIFVYGKEGWFYKKQFRYYYYGEHRYWIIENVCNRDLVERAKHYEIRSRRDK